MTQEQVIVHLMHCIEIDMQLSNTSQTTINVKYKSEENSQMLTGNTSSYDQVTVNI